MSEFREFIREPERRIPVFKRVGVLVCGSGSGGLPAAVCAARNGADVMLIERQSFLGGESTVAYQNWFGGPTDILTGFAEEYAKKLDERGAASLMEQYKKQTAVTGIKPLTYHMAIEPDEWKSLALEVLEEAGVKILTNTSAVDAIVEGNAVKGVIIENKTGRQAIMADVVIDATGDADIAARAGAPIDKLHKGGYLIAMIPGFRLGGLNYTKIAEYARQHPEDFRPGGGVPPGDFDGENTASIQGIAGWYSLIEEGKKKGEFPVDLPSINLQMNPTHIKRGMTYIVGSHLSAFKKDGPRFPWIADDVTRVEFEARMRAKKLVSFLQKRVPGFESCYLLDVSTSVGPQDSRRIIGEYVLTRKDEYEGRVDADTIALLTITWPDVPYTEDSGWGMHPPVEDMDEDWRAPLNGPRFQTTFGVPYRCLIPKGFDGILVAGQTISMTYMAHEPGPCRGMIPCMHWGQAAGTAAAIASKQGISPRKVNAALLRKTLESQGVNLRKEAIDLTDVLKRFEVPGSKVTISHRA
jgi:ribulose 1,5-bisphosphate synthetase/thiazole synthase